MGENIESDLDAEELALLHEEIRLSYAEYKAGGPTYSVEEVLVELRNRNKKKPADRSS